MKFSWFFICTNQITKLEGNMGQYGTSVRISIGRMASHLSAARAVNMRVGEHVCHLADHGTKQAFKLVSCTWPVLPCLRYLWNWSVTSCLTMGYQPDLPWLVSDICHGGPQLAPGLEFYLHSIFLTCFIYYWCWTEPWTLFLPTLLHLFQLSASNLHCLTLHQSRVCVHLLPSACMV